MKGRKLWIIIALSGIFSLAGYAQVPTLRIKYFTKEDGISSSSINHIAQDSTGFIWIATHDGLYKYDGYDFTAFFSKQNDSTSLPGNIINYIYSDSGGRLWIATNNGICLYNEDLDNFIRISDRSRLAGLPRSPVNHIAEDPNGNIYISSNRFIFRYNAETKEFITVCSFEKGTINDFLIGRDYNIWIAGSGNSGLFRENLKTLKDEIVLVAGNDNNILKNTLVNGIALVNEKLWIATFGGGIKMLESNADNLYGYPFNNSDESLAVGVFSDNNNNIWSTDFTGLKILDKQSNTFVGFYPRLNDPQSIRGFVKGVFQDRQGNYWIYHEPGGVGISMRLKGFTHFDNNAQDFWHTSDASILSLQEDSKGNLWIGYANGGIDIFDWQNGTTLRYVNDGPEKFSLGRGAVLCIYRDRQGIMWIGTYLGGLQYFDEEKNGFVSFVNNQNDTNSIAGNDIRSIVEDNEGNLWLAVHSKGVDKFDRTNNRFIHYNNTNNKLSNNWTFQVLVDFKGDLWVATAWGLNHLRKEESMFRNYLSIFNDSTGLTNNLVTTLYEDDNHTIWAGTPSGLNRFNTDKNNFTQYSNIFGSNDITGIEGDIENHLWVSNRLGISVLDPESRKVKNFSTIDGLGSDEYNARALYRSKNNDLLFGGTNGIDIFNPQKLNYNNQPPTVFIDKIKILNEELTIENSEHKLQKHIRRTRKITLDYTDNVITICFKALNFINPQTNLYSYRLQGFEKEWHKAGTIREATYTNLNPGSYIFNVRASNNDGVWNEKGAELIIEVLPPWYKTLVFRIAALILAIALILIYIDLITSQLRKQKIILEKAVNEKTFELSEKNALLNKDSEHLNEVNQLLVEKQILLEQQSEELKRQSENLARTNQELQKLNSTKDRLFSIIAHDLSSPYGAIIGLTDLLAMQFDTLSENEKREYVEMIHISSERQYELLQNLLLWARSQTSRISIKPEKIVVREILSEITELRTESLKTKAIKVKIDCHEDVRAWADQQMLKTILRNLFGNAIKYTPQNGTITFSVIRDAKMINVSITDSGTGIKQSKIDELLFSDIIESEAGTDGEKGSGLGIVLCRDFIKMNNGQLKITSEEGKGSTFTFSLPVIGEK